MRADEDEAMITQTQHQFSKLLQNYLIYIFFIFSWYSLYFLFSVYFVFWYSHDIPCMDVCSNIFYWWDLPWPSIYELVTSPHSLFSSSSFILLFLLHLSPTNTYIFFINNRLWSPRSSECACFVHYHNPTTRQYLVLNEWMNLPAL